MRPASAPAWYHPCMATKTPMSKGTKMVLAFGFLFALQGLTLATLGRKRSS